MARAREDPSALSWPPADAGDKPDRDYATDHASRLLAAFGIAGPAGRVVSDHPALGWRRSGLFDITGHADGPPLVAPVPLTAAADGALAALRAIAPDAALPACGAQLLGERARLLGLSRRGATSANGSCRLLRTRDGHIALNLPRPDDWEMLPALFGTTAGDWPAIETLSLRRATAPLVARGRLLGLAIAPNLAGPIPATPFAILRGAAPRPPPHRAPLVVDLSALWAGPLCASLLGMAGAQVVKVESLRRPDGARAGNARFFDLLNAGKASLTLDFADPAGIARLQALIDQADIVIEGTRPRALAQLGIQAKATVRRGASWVSITGHGRSGRAARWAGFGDDAAVAGGLTVAMGKPLFAGDAIADPLGGIIAAYAAWASWRSGGGRLVDVALSRVVAHACGLGTGAPSWQELAARDTAPLYPMRWPKDGTDGGAAPTAP